MIRRLVLAVSVGYVAGRVARTRRVSRAMHVLRGRPLMYGLTWRDDAIVGDENLRIDTCAFRDARERLALDDALAVTDQLEAAVAEVRAGLVAASTAHAIKFVTGGAS